MAAPITAAPVDRQTTTPFLLKLFYRQSNWHRLDEFAPGEPLPPHLQIYTWPSCSLRELTHLLTSALPTMIPSPAAGTRLAYRLVFPDTKGSTIDPSRPGRYLAKDLGSVIVGSDSSTNATTNGTTGTSLEGDAETVLQDARFVIGDYVSCAILPPLADGSVAPPPVSSGLGMRGGYGGGPSRSAYGPREPDGYSFRGRGPRGGGDFGDRRGPMVPPGDWRRGERIPDRGHGGGYRGGRGGRGRGW